MKHFSALSECGEYVKFYARGWKAAQAFAKANKLKKLGKVYYTWFHPSAASAARHRCILIGS